jgi:hypothetical protein
VSGSPLLLELGAAFTLLGRVDGASDDASCASAAAGSSWSDSFSFDSSLSTSAGCSADSVSSSWFVVGEVELALVWEELVCVLFLFEGEGERGDTDIVDGVVREYVRT